MTLSYDPLVDPPPVEAFDTDQYEASRDDLDGVMRLWLSSIKGTYRRSINGRTTLYDVVDPEPPRRRRTR